METDCHQRFISGILEEAKKDFEGIHEPLLKPEISNFNYDLEWNDSRINPPPVNEKILGKFLEEDGSESYKTVIKKPISEIGGKLYANSKIEGDFFFQEMTWTGRKLIKEPLFWRKLVEETEDSEPEAEKAEEPLLNLDNDWFTVRNSLETLPEPSTLFLGAYNAGNRVSFDLVYLISLDGQEKWINQDLKEVGPPDFWYKLPKWSYGENINENLLEIQVNSYSKTFSLKDILEGNLTENKGEPNGTISRKKVTEDEFQEIRKELLVQ